MNKHVWTVDQVEFLRMYAPGHSYAEITEEVNRVYGLELCINQVRAGLKNRKIRTGRKTQFGAANENTPRRWSKGECPPGCEKSWYKKGNIPYNHKPVGSERIGALGYIEVKVEEPSKYMLKQRKVYTDVHGEIPEGYKVTFKDGNPLNCEIDNLILMSQQAQVEMMRNDLWSAKGENKVAAVNTCELISRIGELKRGGN